MSIPLQETEYYTVLSHPDSPAAKHVGSKLMLKDIWIIEEDLPSLAEQANIRGRKAIYFTSFSQTWLKELVKIVILSKVAHKKWSINHVAATLSVILKFDNWLSKENHLFSLALNQEIIQEWGRKQSNTVKLNFKYFLNTLKTLGIINFKVDLKCTNRNEISTRRQAIPEQVKYKLDIYIKELDPPIFLLFKLIETFGLRSCEIAKIPLNCLTLQGEIQGIFIKQGKQRDRKAEKALLEVLVPLVKEQQNFIRQNFGNDFPWLFAHFTHRDSGSYAREHFPPQFTYHPKQISQSNRKLNKILKRIIKHYDIRTNDGLLAEITTHYFRHTWATVAKRMGKRVDQIQDALGHLNLDMQDTYVNETPQEREKNIVLVNKDGKEIVYKTDTDKEVIRREWKIREIELGLCGRPNIHKSCENDYICFDCPFAYYTQEHIPQLENYLKHNEVIFEKAKKDNQTNSIRANSARQIIAQVTRIIQKIDKRNY